MGKVNISMLNVLYQFDDKYAPYAGISILSLLESNKGSYLIIHCAAMGVSIQNKKKIESMIQQYGQKISWIDVTEPISMINKLGVGAWNGSYATWLKMFVIHKMGDDVEKLLYLDCDTLVINSISNLFDIDLSDCSLACAYDSVARSTARKIGVSAYYNAGVILFNVKRWKEPCFFENMYIHLEKNVTNYTDNDQRLINDYFRNEIKVLPVKYNLQCTHLAYSDKCYFGVYKDGRYYTESDISEARIAPVIYHFFRFLGDYPWEDGNIHPLRNEFQHWKELSKWSDEPMLLKRKK